MEQIEKNIEDWIKPYATIIGDRIDVDIDLKKENPTKYFLRLTLPNHYESLVRTVLEIYGNQEVVLFYTFLSTQSRDKDLMFSGNINDLPTLIKKQELSLTPSLIYPKERNWVVNTDYDLAFSTIGGETRFINKLIELNKDEIFKVEY